MACDFTFAELFAGVGGFRVGLEALGGRCLLACELEPQCRKQYTHAFGGPRGDAFAQDIRELAARPQLPVERVRAERFRGGRNDPPGGGLPGRRLPVPVGRARHPSTGEFFELPHQAKRGKPRCGRMRI